MQNKKSKITPQDLLRADLSPDEIKALPKRYKGYLVSDLLHMWADLLNTKIKDGTPKDKIGAMRDFIREYKLGIFKDSIPSTIKKM
jgi:hypothetical protein